MLTADIPTKNRKIVKLYEREPIRQPNSEYEIIPDGKHKYKIYKIYYSENYGKVYFLLEKDSETLYGYTPNNQFQMALIDLYETKDFSEAYIIIYKKTYPDKISIAIDFEGLKDKAKETVKDIEDIEDDVIKQML
jgi:hypothetical protein